MISWEAMLLQTLNIVDADIERGVDGIDGVLFVLFAPEGVACDGPTPHRDHGHFEVTSSELACLHGASLQSGHLLTCPCVFAARPRRTCQWTEAQSMDAVHTVAGRRDSDSDCHGRRL